MKPVFGLIGLALLAGVLAFGVGKATAPDAKQESQEAVSTQTADPVRAPALASTGSIPALRAPQEEQASTSSSSTQGTGDSSGTTSGGSVGGTTGGGTTGGGTTGGGTGGGDSGGTNNGNPGAGEF